MLNLAEELFLLALNDDKGTVQNSASWVVPYAAYPQQDASAKYWIKQDLRAVVLAGREPDPRRLALLSLVYACRMLPLLLTKDERKAANRRIEALAAVKILPLDLAHQPDFRKRFEREAQAMAALKHPNIVRLYGAGQSDGIDYSSPIPRIDEK